MRTSAQASLMMSIDSPGSAIVIPFLWGLFLVSRLIPMSWPGRVVPWFVTPM